MVLDLSQLFKHSDNTRGFRAGEVIFAEGNAGDSMYVLLEGEVSLSVRGNEFWQLSAGELFGEMALIDAQPRSASATARTDCRVVPIDERRFQFLIQQTPYFALHVMRVLVGRLRAMDATMH